MRRFEFQLSCASGILLCISLITGCGSGAGTNHGAFSTPAVSLPSLDSIAPRTAIAGATSLSTINAYGANFLAGATIQWNGTALDTTSLSTTQISATLPITDLAQPGTATVTVTNPGPGGGTSNSEIFAITALPAATTSVRSVGIAPRRIAWDQVHSTLLATLSSTDPVSPNTVVAVDPIAGRAGTPVPAGDTPYTLSVSSDGAYLWVGLDGDHAIQRFLLPSLTKEILFPLPKTRRGEQQQAVTLEAAPVGSHTMAVVVGNRTYSPAGNGVYVFDDATQRPTSVPGYGVSGGPTIDWIQWGKDDSTVYGNQYTTIDEGGIANLQVTSKGISQVGPYGGLLGPAITQFDRQNGLLYSSGAEYDPARNTQTGRFNTGAVNSEACTADSSISRYFCVVDVYTGVDVSQFELWTFDLNTHALFGRISLGKTISGIAHQLLRWGKAGLALNTISDFTNGDAGLFLIDGAGVNPDTAPDWTTGSPVVAYAKLTSISPQSAPNGSKTVVATLIGSNFNPGSVACSSCNFLQRNDLPTAFVSSTQLAVIIPASALQSSGTLNISVFDPSGNLFSSNAVAFTVSPDSAPGSSIKAVNLAGLDISWDATHALLYVATADYDDAYPNSIVAVDPASGQIGTTQGVSPDPYILSTSAGDQYLYVAFAGATSMTQLALPSLSLPLTWPLNNPAGAGPYFAGDMKAAPFNPHTTAVTLYIAPGGLSYTSVATGGLAIYDDAMQRPTLSRPWVDFPAFPPPEYNVLAWGASDFHLAAAMNDNTGLLPLYTLAVNPSGVSYAGLTPSFNRAGDLLHSDRGTGLVYSDDGNVADPVTGAIVGTYQASGIVVPDSSLNRVFILGQTAAQANSDSYTIESFDQKAFTPVSAITLAHLLGSPLAMVRWGSTGLALLTLNQNSGQGGMLYIVQDSTFVRNAREESVPPFALLEPVQSRWKHLSRQQLGTQIRQRLAGEPLHSKPQ